MNNAFEYLVKNLDWQDGDVAIAGVSGGPDSMALLHLLIRVRRVLFLKDKKITIVCAHVNHKVRKESDDEELFVKEYCEKNKVVFDCYHIEKYDDENFHKDARDKRYAYYERLIQNYQAKYLFTAHHGDDLMETILMRMTRGSSLRGYSGFSKVADMGNYKIIRPLINLTKEEIALYDEKNDIPYVIDKSNFKDVYTRNRYRKYFLPLFKKEDKSVHNKFYKFSLLLQEYCDYVDKDVKKEIDRVYVSNILDIEKFLSNEHIIRMNIIYYILEGIYKDDLMLISDRHTESIYNLITSKKSQGIINLPNNIVCKKEYNELKFIKNEEKDNDYEILLEKLAILPNGKNIEVIKMSDDKSNFVTRIDSSEIKLPLIVRNRKNGDKMFVKNLNGSKKVSDIFIDNKIKQGDREVWPVVVDSENNVIWLPGLKKSKFDKTNDEKYDIILKYY